MGGATQAASLPGLCGLGADCSVCAYAFTLTRYGGLFENGSETAVDRPDLLLGGSSKVSGNVLHLDSQKLR
jgi:hypothetical protein